MVILGYFLFFFFLEYLIGKIIDIIFWMFREIVIFFWKCDKFIVIRNDDCFE